MEVKLTPEMERWVAEQVKVGRFADAGAAVRAGVQMLRVKEEYEVKLRTLREDVRVALARLDGASGDEVDFEEALLWLADWRDGPDHNIHGAEIVEEGLELLRSEDARKARLEALRRDIQVGLDQAERGELLDGEEVFRQLLESIAAHDDTRV